MASMESAVPPESFTLCENCGYVLSGLPETGNCPECGVPIAQSIDPDRRQPCAWDRRRWSGFLSTSLAVLFRPTHFYRHLQSRLPASDSRAFAFAHWAVASLLYAIAAVTHARVFLEPLLSDSSPIAVVLVIAAIGSFVAVALITKLAARLSAWEAAYRGLRIPLGPVLRAMHFHAAHYLPVGIVAVITTVGYQFALNRKWLAISTLTAYLYVLSAEIIGGAAYLFFTYWIGMKNIMYANR